MNKMLLLDEADKQIKAIFTLKKWMRLSISFSTILMVLSYFSLNNFGLISPLGIISILFTSIFICIALILNLGIRNGERNIEEILKASQSIK